MHFLWRLLTDSARHTRRRQGASARSVDLKRSVLEVRSCTLRVHHVRATVLYEVV